MTESGAGAASNTPFRILTVCTGNICRSPMAERLLQAGLDERFPGQFVVESAGTGALVGNPIDPRVAGFIRVLGGTADDFSARQLDPEILKGQDLVLALTREHRSRVVELAPAMLRKAFVLREFDRLLAITDLGTEFKGADRWREALPLALRKRTAVPAEDDDVVDPFGRPESIYLEMFRKLQPSVRRLAEF